MGCSSSKTTTTIDDTKATAATTTTAPTLKKDSKMEYPASEAFTIPLDDDVASEQTDQLNDTLRQPPKRLQQLMQQAAETEPLTLEELEDKQLRAEQRRQELMQQKIESIQKNTQMLMRGNGEDGDGEQGEGPQQSVQD